MASGASEKEAEELSFLSKNFANLYGFERSNSIKEEFLGRRRKTVYISGRLFTGSLFGLILFFLFVSVVSAQNSLPGNPLYPVKRLSENVISTINPSFKNVMLKRRSEEIRALSDTNNSKEMENIIQSYEKILHDNKKINKQSVSESKKNLEEAEKRVSESNKKGLDNAILETEQFQTEISSGSSSLEIQNKADEHKGEQNQNKIQENLKQETDPVNNINNFFH